MVSDEDSCKEFLGTGGISFNDFLGVTFGVGVTVASLEVSLMEPLGVGVTEPLDGAFSGASFGVGVIDPLFGDVGGVDF